MTQVLGLSAELAQRLLEAEGVRVEVIPYEPRRKVLKPDETRVVRVREGLREGAAVASLMVCACKAGVYEPGVSLGSGENS